MAFINEWVTNIIIFILLATVIDMLLPSSNLQKYTKLVTGLLLIAIILTPIFKLISSDFEDAISSLSVLNGVDAEEKNMENLIELKKKEIQASQNAYILETMAVQLKEEVEEGLINQYGVTITNIDFKINSQDSRDFPQNLEKVIVTVSHDEQESEAIETIKSIEISAEKPLPSEQNNQSDKIAAHLSHEWNIAEKMIEVLMEEGGI